MFGSREKKNATTVVASDATFEGSLNLKGAAHIEGHFIGDLTAEGEVSVGPDGSVVGSLNGELVTIAGQVEGRVIARTKLVICRSGSVKGELFYEKLQVEAGGVLDGRVHNAQPQRATEDAAEISIEASAPTPDGQSGVGKVNPVDPRFPPRPQDVSHAAGRR